MLESGTTFKGVRGLVKHAYHTAAEVTTFEVTLTRGAPTVLTALIVTSDAYWLEQRPLTFVVPTRGGAVRWPIESITVTDGRVVARLGQLERATE
jgi:hypothetical protein